LDEAEFSVSILGHFTHSEKAPDIHWIGESVFLKASLNGVTKKKYFPLPDGNQTPIFYFVTQ
jgi:hypothetical protein